MATILPSPLKSSHDFVVYRDVRIPMGDGTELSADITFPSVDGVPDLKKRYPVVLSRSPYRDLGMAVSPPHIAYFCAERGYVYVYCSVRGTGRSDGELEPMANEGWGASSDGYGGHTDGVDARLVDGVGDQSSEDFYAGLRAGHSLRDVPIVRHLDYYQRWLDNRDNPAFFAYNDVRSRSHAVQQPTLFHTGWFDLFSLNAIEGFCQMVREAPSEEVARSHRLVVGAWGHMPSPLVRRFPEAETDDRLMAMEWIEQQVRGHESAFFRDNPVSLFVMGENRWRGEQEWPLADEQRTRLYLRSAGSANTLAGDGALSVQVPAPDEPADCYTYDPADPVFFRGGIGVLCGGQCDQYEAEQREDVLVYTGEVLEEDVEVTGNVSARLFAATSAEDTDFFVRLLDVCPDGTVWNVVSGGRRGRYVQEGRTKPVPLEPGKVYAYDVSLRATSYVFKRGHRIRVDVTSSDTLHADVNPNAFVDLNSCTAADYVVAQQRVLHDAEHASYVELPIIPASHERRWIDEWPFSAQLTGVESIWASFAPESQPVKRLDGDEIS